MYWGKSIRQLVLLWGVVLCFVALEMVAVSCTTSSLITNTEMTSMIVIRQADAGQYFTARTGDMIEVILEENPSTGYLWKVTEIDRNILDSLESSFFSGGDTIVGKSGTRKFQFEVKAPGETVISFRLNRPWENEADAIEQFQVTIHALED